MRLCAITTALLAGAFAPSGCATPENSPGVMRVERADFVLDDSASPPTIDGNWAPVALPDLWSETRPEVEGSGWYRFVFDHSGDDARYSVYLPKVNMNAAVFVNGHWVGDGGDFDPPVSQNWNRPLFFPFSSEILRARGNVVQVRVYAYAHDWGGLHPFYVGPMDALSGAAAVQHAWQITSSQVASLLVLFLALLLGVVSIGQKEEVYRFWALACVVYFVHSLSSHIREIAVPYHLGRWLIHTSLDIFALLLVFGFHRWAGVSRPRLERFLIAASICAATTTLLVPAKWFLPIANIIHLVALLLGVYASLVMARRFRQSGGAEAIVNILAGAIVLVVGTHALLIYFGVLPQDSPRLLKLIAPLLMVAFGGVLVARFVRAIAAADALNEDLAARVAEKEAALVVHFDRIREMESKRLLVVERTRLMREMHDGMGSSLVSLLAMVEEGEPSRRLLTGSLQAALEEMRFVIDSLDPEIDNIGALLGLIRERIEPRLEGQGLRFRWRVFDVPDDFVLTPEQSLDVLRIIQECLTNVIKHAGASVVEVSTEIKGAGAERLVLMTIDDDGRGFDASAPRGRGLANLMARSERLGASLRITSSAEGTRVVLELSCPKEVV